MLIPIDRRPSIKSVESSTKGRVNKKNRNKKEGINRFISPVPLPFMFLVYSEKENTSNDTFFRLKPTVTTDFISGT